MNTEITINNQPRQAVINTSAYIKYKYLITIEMSSGYKYIGFNDETTARKAFLATVKDLKNKDFNFVMELKYSGYFSSFKLPKYPEYVEDKLISPVNPKILMRKLVLGSFESD